MSQVKLSPKQKEFLRDSTAKINIAHGSVRSGKTYSTLLRFAELVIDCPDNKIIMIGNSFGAIKENAVKLLTDELFRGYCVWKPGKQALIFGDKEIRVIGAHDEGSIRAIQGNTHSLSYVDEITTIPYGFVDMLTTRLSHPWSKLIATCNPSSPVHPVKANLIDNPDPDYCYNLHFNVDDNPALDERTRNDLKKQYTGLFYRRYILGEWVAAEGSIYSDFSRSTHVLPRAPHYADNYFVGVDYGIHNAFAAVLIGHNNSHSPHLWVEKELYWDSKKTYRQKLNSELADDLEQFIDGYNVRGIYLDPSASSFEVECKRRKMRIIQAKNDVYAGITFVANLISNHELKIVADCKNTIGEIESYVWDSKKAEGGREEPVKKNDHCFCSGTLIKTMRGNIPIERVTTNDFVLTRAGYKPVFDVGHNFKECFEYLFYGKTIQCTPDHKFYTAAGWKEIQSLIQSDILFTNEDLWGNTRKDLLENPNPLSLMAEPIDDIQALKTSLNEIISLPKVDFFIEKFGNSIMDQYPKGTIFITKMGTRLTMIYPTCNVSLPSNISNCMNMILGQIALQMQLELQLLSGTNPIREGNGIESTQQKCSSVNGNHLSNLATSADALIQQQSDLNSDSVRINVSQNGAEILVLMMSKETASIAIKSSYQTDMQKSIAVQNLAERKCLGRQKVYNMSVTDHPEFFANGLLVHNSTDALRYALFTAFGERKNLKWGEGNFDSRTLGGGRQF